MTQNLAIISIIIIIFSVAFFFLAPVIQVTYASTECGRGTRSESLSFYLWHVGYSVYMGSFCYDPRWGDTRGDESRRQVAAGLTCDGFSSIKWDWLVEIRVCPTKI